MAATSAAVRTPTPVLLSFSGPWKAVDSPSALGNAAPAFADFDECKARLATSDDSTAKMNQMLYNKVRVCGGCKKPNGFTLKNCNACGHDISATDVTKTLNVFSGFMLAIAKSTFPLTVSLRLETPEHIVLDDLLALSPAHVNVIPTKHFVPDWRFLLRRPEQGLAVAKKLKELAVQAMRANFLEDAAFLSQFTSVDPESNPFSPEADLACGFNFPPSQNQLHLQCIFPVVLPYQYYLYEKGTHFTPGRFFPYEYVVQALACAAERPLPPALLQDETAIEDIIAHFAKHHTLDAEAVRLQFVHRFEANYKKFQRWDATRFALVGKEDEASKKLAVVAAADGAPSAEDAMAVVNKDKTALQSYGRPYTAEGKPTGKFYKFGAKSVDEITFW
jgi:hypothetical protein